MNANHHPCSALAYFTQFLPTHSKNKKAITLIFMVCLRTWAEFTVKKKYESIRHFLNYIKMNSTLMYIINSVMIFHFVKDLLWCQGPSYQFISQRPVLSTSSLLWQPNMTEYDTSLKYEYLDPL